MTTTDNKDAVAGLLVKINEAVAAVNQAEMKVTTAQAELVSRAKTVGLLLLEAKKLHPAVKDFEAFLGKAQGLKLSRAYDYIAIAGGRKTVEEIERQRAVASRSTAPARRRSCRGRRQP